MNVATTPAPALDTLRAASAKLMALAITNIGGCKVAPSVYDLPTGTRVRIYKAGRNSFALITLNSIEAWYGNTAGGMVLADVAAGNVNIIHC